MPEDLESWKLMMFTDVIKRKPGKILNGVVKFSRGEGNLLV